jgi:methyl-accepting chemotaxis protein
MFKKISLKLKLMIGFIFIALLAGLIGFFGWFGIEKTSEKIVQLGENNIPTLMNLERITNQISDKRTAMRTLMISYNNTEDVKNQIQNIEESQVRLKSAMDKYEKTPRTKKEDDLWKNFKKMNAESEKTNENFLALAKKLLTNPENSAQITQKLYSMGMDGKVRKEFRELLSSLDRLKKYSLEYYAREEVNNAINLGNRMNFIIVITSLAGFIIALLTGLFLSKGISDPLTSITEKIDSSSGQLSSAASQVSSSSEELSSGASELASSVEEITSSMEELQATIENNTKNTREAEGLMDETKKGTEKVSRRMKSMQKSMEEISESSEEIGKIIKVIDDIAFQTNILALNAAVEAARAGDAGKGFVVVADQVKDLAGKSATAAKQTASLIEKAINNVADGRESVDEVIDSQKIAAELAERVNILLTEVSESSKEQLKGANQVTQGITQINSVVQQAASSSEELAASGEELVSQGESMQEIVETLTKLVQGAGNRSGGNHSPKYAKEKRKAPYPKKQPSGGKPEIITPDQVIRKDFSEF